MTIDIMEIRGKKIVFIDELSLGYPLELDIDFRRSLLEPQNHSILHRIISSDIRTGYNDTDRLTHISNRCSF